MEWMIHIGLGELAVGALLGWAMVLVTDAPEKLKGWGVVAPHRVRQVHLDYIFMGLILIGVGLAVPSLSDWIAIPLVFGTLMNPALFVPLAFSRDADKKPWYRALAFISFTCVSGGLVAAVIAGPG